MSSTLVWRLCAAKYRDTAFSGEGARLYGGRAVSTVRLEVFQRAADEAAARLRRERETARS